MGGRDSFPFILTLGFILAFAFCFLGWCSLGLLLLCFSFLALAFLVGVAFLLHLLLLLLVIFSLLGWGSFGFAIACFSFLALAFLVGLVFLLYLLLLLMSFLVLLSGLDLHLELPLTNYLHFYRV